MREHGSRGRGVLIAAIAAMALLAAGCYERVVGAKGFGADMVTVNRPSSPDGSGGPRVVTPLERKKTWE